MSREPHSDPLGGEHGWSPPPPASIVPVPAANASELRGRRVIVGLPGLGWRPDMRGDDRVVQGSRTFVPVLAEHEWYRAEAEQIEVFAPLVPIERVWVETVAVEGSSRPATPRSPDVASRLVSLDGPPRRDPIAAVDVDGVTGRRMVQTSEGVERRDLRAVTELYANPQGDVCLRVTTELEWYRWAWSGKSPRTLELPVHVLWVE
ncbi:MAG TPA: hypothetical protein VGJ63_05240 [Micromonosporaceae bacterium]